jgi:sugar lactone lactonase YvrE
MSVRIVLTAAAVALLTHAADRPPEYKIDTIAGADTNKNDEGGPASLAFIESPTGIAVGPHGEIYFAERDGHRIRAINGAGTIRTIAGTGVPGRSGGGPAIAIETKLQSPDNVATDRSGAVYIADTFNHAIRKVTPDGRISTLVFPDQLRIPRGIAVDDRGNLYVADSANHVIRKIDGRGQASILAGTRKEGWGGDGGSALKAQLQFPDGLAIDRSGTLYVADSNNDRIRAIDHTGKIRAVAGSSDGYDGDGRQATKTLFVRPVHVAVDEQGNLFVAEEGKSRVRMINRSGIVCTVLGAAAPSPNCRAPLPFDGAPSGLALDRSGALYVSDSAYDQIFRVDANRMTAIAGIGPGDGIAATLARFSNLHASLDPMNLRVPRIALDRNGNIYVSDGSRVRMIDATGVVRTIAGANSGDVGGTGDGGPSRSALLSDPEGIAVNAAGAIFFADADRIRKIEKEIISRVAGDVQGAAGGEDQTAKVKSYLHGLALTPAGTLFATDINNNRLVKVDGEGTLRTVAAAPLNYPTGVAADAGGALYICDSGNHAIRRFGPDGVMTSLTAAGVAGFYGDDGPAASARLRSPKGIAVGRDGVIYIADTGNHRVRTIRNGIIYTIAGKNSRGFDGDGGPAGAAHLDTPSDVAVDDAGNIYVFDYGNGRIRKLTPIQ